MFLAKIRILQELALTLSRLEQYNLTQLILFPVSPFLIIKQMAYSILKRLSFGPTPSSLETFKQMGLEAYLEEQLHPDPKEDQILLKKLAQFRFDDAEPAYKGKGFEYLDAPAPKLWKLLEKENDALHALPSAEVFMVTCLRAAYSKWQLQERLVQFWHNHFNVSIETSEQVAVSFPLYDKVMRTHCLGNFRDFLEAVAQSPSMLFYLNNATSRASPANENFARELLELHTLGKKRYWNDRYEHWKEVPGATTGLAEGYIDDDVYEAARAFTGWTIADGAWTEGGDKPNTGEFIYLEAWHDHYQKRILGVEFESHQGPLKDGQQVLDLLAYHEGTAQFVCYKLCQYLVQDAPNEALVAAAVQTWQTQQKAPDQLRQVIRTIVLHASFQTALNQKVKPPFDLFISTVRQLELPFKPNIRLRWILNDMGYPIFTWPSPAGYPNQSSYWLNSSMMLRRWNLFPTLLLHEWHYLVQFDLEQHQQQANTPLESSQAIVEFWIHRILGEDAPKITPPQKTQLVQLLLREERGPNDPLLTYSKEDKKYLLGQLVCAIFMAPPFQYY